MSKRMQRRCYRYWCFERDAKVKPKGYYKCWFTRCLYYTSVMGAFKVIVSIAITAPQWGSESNPPLAMATSR